LAAGLAFTTLYLLGMRYVGGGDTVASELLPLSLLVEGDLDFNEFTGSSVELPYYLARVGDRVVSFYSIVPGLMNVPSYAVASWLGIPASPRTLSKVTCAVVMGASAAAMYLVLLRVCSTRRDAALMTGLYGLATCAWSVGSTGLWQHGPSLLLLACALVCLLDSRSRSLPLAGLFLGVAIFNRPTNIVFGLPLSIYVARHHRDRFAWYVVALALPLAAMAAYSQSYWGSIWSLGQGHPWGTHEQHGTGFRGALWPNLAGLLFSPGRGLFIYSPIFLFSIVGLCWVRVRPLYPYLVVGAIGHLVLHAKWSIWWGGHSFGYRMLIEMIPALMILLAIAWDRLIAVRGALRTILWATAVASVYVQLLGTYAYPSGWNSEPVDVDHAPGRLWDVWDTELGRCHVRLIRNHLP
jgi:hypothetical protein